MAQVYFHCSNSRGSLIDRCGADVDDLVDARDHAARLVWLLVWESDAEDWRNWTLHVCDDLGDEILAVPFASVLGKPH